MTTSVTEGDETHLPDPSIEVNISHITLWFAVNETISFASFLRPGDLR